MADLLLVNEAMNRYFEAPGYLVRVAMEEVLLVGVVRWSNRVRYPKMS